METVILCASVFVLMELAPRLWATLLREMDRRGITEDEP